MRRHFGSTECGGFVGGVGVTLIKSGYRACAGERAIVLYEV